MNARYRADGRQGHALRAHAERLGPRGRPHADRGAGELPERGRLASTMPEALRPYMGGLDDRIEQARPDRMRILVTNDDGIHAPGLEALERDRRARCPTTSGWWRRRSTRAAPAHSLSLTDPLRAARGRASRRFAVDGTPTDCVILGVQASAARTRKPDLVLSGVNRGTNIAEDVTYSGTIAGAMEGTHARHARRSRFARPMGRAGATPSRGNAPSITAPAVVRKILDAGHRPAASSSTSTSPIASPTRSRGIAVVDAGQRTQELLAHRRAPRRPRQSLFLGRLRKAPVHSRQRHRPLGASPTGASR